MSGSRTTSPSYESFGPIPPGDETLRTHLPAAGADPKALPDHVKARRAEQWDQFVLKKGPDFKSRLVTYLNVLGPNPRQRATVDEHWRRIFVDDSEDLCWPIRRAIFIRHQFALKDDQRLEIDRGVLRALLEVPRYKAGLRSLEVLCQHLRDRAGSGAPHRSHVPGHQLLDMHVDAAEFWRICERDAEITPIASKLAHALHEAYRIRVRRNPKKQHLDVPFDRLSDDLKAANRGQAQRIPEILRIAGLKLTRGETIPLADLLKHRQDPGVAASEDPLRARLTDQDMLEILAEAEHNGWMVERMLNGWRYSPHRDDAKKLHDALLPYNQLPHEIQDYDRHTIKGAPPRAGESDSEQFGYLDVVKTAGFRVQVAGATSTSR